MRAAWPWVLKRVRLYWLAFFCGWAKGLTPLNCQMLAGTYPMKCTWMVASSERAWKARLASEPPHRGDAPPDAPLDASLHSTIHTFRRCLAVWCCFVAATDSLPRAPLLCWLRGQRDHCCPVALPLPSWQLNWSGSFVVPVGSVWTGIGTVYDVTRHLRYHGTQQPPASCSSVTQCRFDLPAVCHLRRRSHPMI